MAHPLRLLIVDDQPSDAELSASLIQRGGYSCIWHRVETDEAFRKELHDFEPDLILSDFNMPAYDGLSALSVAATEAPHTPFIFVSGTLGEKRASDALASGASDYVSKGDMTRLLPAVSRALSEEPAVEGAPQEPGVRLSAVPSARAAFVEHLTRRLIQADEADTNTVMMFDIERLRDVNEQHGRAHGDRAVAAVRDRLRRRFGSGPDLTHLGGGTFAVVFADRRVRPGAVPEPSTSMFSEPFMVDAQPVSLTIKCSLARYPHHGTGAASLLRCAELALGQRRERHRTAAQSGAQILVDDEQLLELRLGRALHERHFFLHYQPIIERVSGRITAVEALLRWRDPQLGLVPPAVFLPILIHSGQMSEVGEWVLDQATHDLQSWHSSGLGHLRMAVNLSAAELSRKDFAAYFLSRTQHGYNPASVDIDVSESALLEHPQAVLHTLRQLQAEGVRIAVDDFGRAPTALAQLDELPINSLKIDRSFISHLTSAAPSQTFISAVIDIARADGLQTIAKGVESFEQFEILDALGCDHTQGHLHCPAISAAALEHLMLLQRTGSPH